MRRVLTAVWTFVVGDDWVAAAAIVVAGGATAALEAAGITAWWVMPLAVAGLIAHAGVRGRRDSP